MGPRTFHILYNGLGLLQGVAHGTNDNSSRCNGFGYLVLIPVKTVGISPFLTVNQGILVHSAHVVHRVDGGSQADGLCHHGPSPGLMALNHSLRPVA